MSGLYIIKAFIRQAKKTEDPIATLEALQAGQFEKMDGDGTLTGTTVNGKAFSWTLPPGMSPADIMVYSEVALQHLEREIEPTNKTAGRIV
jgi:hypothetical protein